MNKNTKGWIKRKDEDSQLKWYIEFYNGDISIYVYHDPLTDVWWAKGTHLEQTPLDVKNESEAKYAAMTKVWNKLSEYAATLGSFEFDAEDYDAVSPELKTKLFIEEWNGLYEH